MGEKNFQEILRFGEYVSMGIQKCSEIYHPDGTSEFLQTGSLRVSLIVESKTLHNLGHSKIVTFYQNPAEDILMNSHKICRKLLEFDIRIF